MLSFFALPAVAPRATALLVTQSSVRQTKVRFGRYEAELRLPAEGVFANEAMDLEFRVVDTTQPDPVETGFRGVGGIQATAILSMPSMAGMPPALPNVHREGVPGDYGVELFFPHGGEFELAVRLEIPGQSPQVVRWTIPVNDERPAGLRQLPPYRLAIVNWPKGTPAKTPISLQMQVIDTKTRQVQTEFDESHTKKFHLLITSRDLNWFVHEHPEMGPDGTWSIQQTFPAGGKYWVYGDVAPSGQGARILVSQVSVPGPKPTWDTRLIPTRKATDRQLRGILVTRTPVEAGQSAEIEVKLFDRGTGMPVGDTKAWLGAAGHLMIIHQDGQTVVHSHPSEGATSDALVQRGQIRFRARFPKPGLYKAYAQFSWHESVHTLGFVLKVKN